MLLVRWIPNSSRAKYDFFSGYKSSRSFVDLARSCETPVCIWEAPLLELCCPVGGVLFESNDGYCIVTIQKLGCVGQAANARDEGTLEKFSAIPSGK